MIHKKKVELDPAQSTYTKSGGMTLSCNYISSPTNQPMCIVRFYAGGTNISDAMAAKPFKVTGVATYNNQSLDKLEIYVTHKEGDPEVLLRSVDMEEWVVGYEKPKSVSVDFSLGKDETKAAEFMDLPEEEIPVDPSDDMEPDDDPDPYETHEPCEKCDGTGVEDAAGTKCYRCEGTGVEPDTKISPKIPTPSPVVEKLAEYISKMQEQHFTLEPGPLKKPEFTSQSVIGPLLDIPNITQVQVDKVDAMSGYDAYDVTIEHTGDVNPADVCDRLKSFGLTMESWTATIVGGSQTKSMSRGRFRYHPLVVVDASATAFTPHANLHLEKQADEIFKIKGDYYVTTKAVAPEGYGKGRTFLTMKAVKAMSSLGVVMAQILETNMTLRVHFPHGHRDYVVEDAGTSATGPGGTFRTIRLRPLNAAPDHGAWEAVRTTEAGGILFMTRDGKAVLGIEPGGKVVVNPECRMYAGKDAIEIGWEIADDFWKAVSSFNPLLKKVADLEANLMKTEGELAQLTHFHEKLKEKIEAERAERDRPAPNERSEMAKIRFDNLGKNVKPPEEPK